MRLHRSALVAVVTLSALGAHPGRGTQNALMSLGRGGVYLELSLKK